MSSIKAGTKRGAPSGGANISQLSSAGAKKRKTDTMQKFYAVKSGFIPGVYLTYAECQQQTAGFRGAIFKSFTSREDAEAFAAGRKVESADTGPVKYYAVAVGTPTGIFTDWNDASMSIKGVKGPKYRKFSTQAEAVDYIKLHGNEKAFEDLGDLRELASSPSFTPAMFEVSPQKTATRQQQQPAQTKEAGLVEIYTDGSSLANGKAGSRAGVGVYFGDGDPRNIAERLPGEPQTNQRAELMAMQRALEVVPKDQKVRIYSDSQYSIKCVTQWAAAWRQKGWRTATGQEVKNQDLIRAILDLLEERKTEGGLTTFEWVKGHSASKGNAAADRLAVSGANMRL